MPDSPRNGRAATPTEDIAVRGRLAGCHDCAIVDEADHRIANHLSLLASFVRLRAIDLAQQPAAPNAEAVQILLETIRAQIDLVGRLHRALAANGCDAPADLTERLHDICAPLAAVLSGRIDLVEDFAPSGLVAPHQMVPLAQMVAEAVTNAVKHAYAPGAPGRIVVRSRGQAGGGLVIEVIDDGPGLPPEFDARTGGGLGFRLIRTLGRQIGAGVAFESAGSGLCVRLSLPSAGLA